MLGLLRGNDWGWSSGRVTGLFAAAAALLVAFAFVELRQARPMFDIRLFRVPTFAGAQITAFAMSAGMFSLFLYLALYIENVLGYSAVATGVRFLPLSLLAFVAAPISGRLSARLPVRILLGGGLALIGVALLLMHGMTLGSSWTTLLAGFLVGGIGIGMVNAPLAATAVSVVEQRQAEWRPASTTRSARSGSRRGSRAWAPSSRAGSRRISPRFGSSPARSRGRLRRRNCGSVDAAGRAPPRAAAAFISGLNEILLVAAFVLFAGAILAFALVRGRDFVASGPGAQGGS